MPEAAAPTSKSRSPVKKAAAKPTAKKQAALEETKQSPTRKMPGRSVSPPKKSTKAAADAVNGN
jgi:hypothetical protein